MIPPDQLDADPAAAPGADGLEETTVFSPAPPPKPAKRDPLFFAVIFLLVLDIVFGLGLAVFAQRVLEFPPMAVVGLGLSVMGIGILAYFLLLGDGRATPAKTKRSGKP